MTGTRTLFPTGIVGPIRPLPDGTLWPEAASVRAYDLADDDGPVVDLHLRRINDHPVLVGIAVGPNGEPRHLTMRQLRAISDTLVAEAIRSVALNVAASTPAPYRVDVKTAGDGAVGARRRRAITPALLQQVAEIHRANPDAPVGAVADQLHCSARTAARWVAEARKRGRIPPTGRKGPSPRGTD